MMTKCNEFLEKTILLTPCHFWDKPSVSGENFLVCRRKIWQVLQVLIAATWAESSEVNATLPC
ncbi:hypothetical protein DZA65_01490 [Dickeya dianthicola]|nr:hypothetical protein DZA65_01490 [Dickeya dianthicola]